MYIFLLVSAQVVELLEGEMWDFIQENVLEGGAC